MYRTKKIEGQKNKIELGPLEESSSSSKVKRVLMKTQEYYKKRYTLFAQERMERWG